jgi:hypothetical protein
MNILKPILILACVQASAALSAQITLNAADVPPIGAELRYGGDTLVAGLSPGPGGAGREWDFSALSAHDTFLFRVLSPDQTPLPEAFPEANISVEVNGIYTFGVLSDTALLNLGATVSLLGAPYLIRFVPPAQLFRFPSTLGTSFEQRYRFSAQIAGAAAGLPVDSVRLLRHTHERVAFDAAGWLTTPGGVFETLRAHIESATIDSVFVYDRLFGIWFPISATPGQSRQYQWVAAGGTGLALTLFLDEDGMATRADWLLGEAPPAAAPQARFTIETLGEGAFAFQDQSSNEPDYWNWDFGDGNASAEQNPTHTYAESGVYTVCLSVGNSAGIDSSCQTLNVALTSSMQNLALHYGFDIFPVPAREKLNLRLRPIEGRPLLLVFHRMSGEPMHRLLINGDTYVDTQAWPNGIYFFTLRSPEGLVLGGGRLSIVK